jgi:ParB-like chromosome segregation protein Spo0J
MRAPPTAKRIEMWPLDRLVPYEKNARTHSPEQVAQIAASITEFGFTNPILVDGADGILAGHGRLAAAKDMSLALVPVIVLDHLSAAQRKAYILADNQLALNAGWDENLLQQELISLQLADFDLSLLGFDENELEGFLNDADLEDGVDATAGKDQLDDADTQVVIGSYRFALRRDAYMQWRDAIREQVGFEEDEIETEILRRLQIPA